MHLTDVPNIFAFDSPFYRFHSQFVSGINSIKQAFGGLCDNAAIPSFSAGNFVYLCNQAFDGLIASVPSAPCLTATGDPTTGQTSPTFANCPLTSLLTAASALYKSQDTFGKGAFTIPLWSGINQFAYPISLARAVLNKGSGLAHQFDWLNIRKAALSAVTQGLRSRIDSLSALIDGTWASSLVKSGIYETLGWANPDSPQSFLNRLSVKTVLLAKGQQSWKVTPDTWGSFLYTVKSDAHFQTGHLLTSFDLDLSLRGGFGAGTGSWGFKAFVTGTHRLGINEFAVDVKNAGIKGWLELGRFSPLIIPGRLWSGTCTPQTWDADVASAFTNFAAANATIESCMNIDPTKLQPSFDPLAAGILVGTGPWVCLSSTNVIGGGCSSSNNQSPPVGGTITLQRYGFGTVPGGSLNTYHHASGNLALWAWSQDRGVFSTDFLNFGVVSFCFAKPVGTSGCTVWQHGIGGSAAGTMVSLQQVSIVQRFVGVNWVEPYDWINSPPQNIIAFPPVLYEGSVTLNPCNIDPVNGYDC
jgi:hypothetical protein